MKEVGRIEAWKGERSWRVISEVELIAEMRFPPHLTGDHIAKYFRGKGYSVDVDSVHDGDRRCVVTISDPGSVADTLAAADAAMAKKVQDEYEAHVAQRDALGKVLKDRHGREYRSGGNTGTGEIRHYLNGDSDLYDEGEDEINIRAERARREAKAGQALLRR